MVGDDGFVDIDVLAGPSGQPHILGADVHLRIKIYILIGLQFHITSGPIDRRHIDGPVVLDAAVHKFVESRQVRTAGRTDRDVERIQ